MPDMTPTSLVVVVAPRIDKFINNGLCHKVRIYTDEKLTFLEGACHLKGQEIKIG